MKNEFVFFYQSFNSGNQTNTNTENLKSQQFTTNATTTIQNKSRLEPQRQINSEPYANTPNATLPATKPQKTTNSKTDEGTTSPTIKPTIGLNAPSPTPNVTDITQLKFAVVNTFAIVSLETCILTKKQQRTPDVVGLGEITKEQLTTLVGSTLGDFITVQNSKFNCQKFAVCTNDTEFELLELNQTGCACVVSRTYDLVILFVHIPNNKAKNITNMSDFFLDILDELSSHTIRKTSHYYPDVVMGDTNQHAPRTTEKALNHALLNRQTHKSKETQNTDNKKRDQSGPYQTVNTSVQHILGTKAKTQFTNSADSKPFDAIIVHSETFELTHSKETFSYTPKVQHSNKYIQDQQRECAVFTDHLGLIASFTFTQQASIKRGITALPERSPSIKKKLCDKSPDIQKAHRKKKQSKLVSSFDDLDSTPLHTNRHTDVLEKKTKIHWLTRANSFDTSHAQLSDELTDKTNKLETHTTNSILTEDIEKEK